MAAALQEQLRQRRLSPIELIREALNFTRERWRTLLVIGLVTITLPRIFALLVDTRAVDPRLDMGFAETILVARGVARVLADWMASLGAMSTALVVIAWVQGMTLEPPAALRRPFAEGRRWVFLMLLLELVGLLRGGLDLGLGLVLTTPTIPGMFHAIHLAFGLAALYVTMATFAFILEDARPIAAIQLSIRRVRGNWLWLAVGMLVLDASSWLLDDLLRPMPAGVPHMVIGLLIRTVVESVSCVILTLFYINLMSRAQERERLDPSDGLQTAVSGEALRD